MKAIQKNRYYILIPVIIGLIVIITYALVYKKPVEVKRPELKNGVLDLSAWNFNRDGNINLTGPWEFYWNRLVYNRDFVHNPFKPDAYVHVPGVWNKYILNGEKCSQYGYASYVLNIKGAPNREMALRVPNLSSSYRLYVNDVLVASDGKVGSNAENARPAWHLRTALFKPSSDDFRIIIQVSNFTYIQGGVWNPIIIGSIENIYHYNSNVIRKDLFLIGGILIAALFSFGIYLIQRKQKLLFYFALLGFLVIIRMSLFDSLFILSVFPGATYEQILFLAYIAVCWAPVVYIYFVFTLFPEYAPKFLNRLLWIPGLETIMCIILPTPLYLQLSYGVTFVAIVEIIFILIHLFKAFADHARNAGIMLAAAGISTVTTVYDSLYQQYLVIEGSMALSPFGLFIFIIMQAFVISRVNHRIREENENIRRNLADSLNKERDLTERLSRLDELKDEFLANTSHELKTPLNAIINISDGLLNQSEGKLNQNQEEYLRLITASGRRLANLINDILDFSKVKHGYIKLNFARVDLRDVAIRVITLFKYLQASEAVSVLMDIPEDLPAVYGDSDRIIQILHNLIENALKFTPEGYVKISARAAGDYIKVTVEDTGIGIPEDKYEVIFIAYEQLEDSAASRYGGIGLGLPITKKLIELHDGKINVYSYYGQGTVFDFTLPVLKDQEAGRLPQTRPDFPGEAQIINETKLHNKNHSGASILVVDDNHANLQAVSIILNNAGYNVITTSSAREALNIIRNNHRLCLVILDVMMPEMSGYELCREIRTSKSLFDLPVLMLTVKTAVHDLVAGFDAGANDYLSKPFEAGELTARVGTLVQLKLAVERSIANEISFLQAQSKPHFLYNALSVIASLSTADPQESRKLIVKLSEYLRNSFDFDSFEDLIPIFKELELVDSYIEIEKARFGDRLDFEFICDDMPELTIPRLVIQPLVENAIRHGIMKKVDGGRVYLKIWPEDQKIYFEIGDDGVGMTEEEQQNIMRGESQGVGVKNIDRRLKKYYGTGLEFTSTAGKGTVVKYYIPFTADMDAG
ncbi:MAG: ATP-binding protein [Syntrophomonas sp.]